jgi:hypothetical protein
MTLGSPFKFRFGRVSPGMLATPDVYKYKLPCPIAFVFPNSEKEARNLVQGNVNRNPSHTPAKRLLSSGDYKINQQCQQQVVNYNTCLRNNKSENCSYYSSYLNNNCLN